MRRHDADMDRAGLSFSARRSDRFIDVTEVELMAAHRLQRVFARGDCSQRHFDGMVAMAAPAFHREIFELDNAQRKIGDLLIHVARGNHQSASFHVQHVHRRKDCCLGGRGDVDNGVDASTRRDLAHPLAQIFFLDIDGKVGAETLRDFKAARIAREPGDNDAGRAGFLGSKYAT